MEIKNVLVTGGAGFLGKAIVKKLLKKDLNVTSFSRIFYPELEMMGVMQVQGDLADKKAVLNAVKKIDAVFHVAAKPGLWGPFEQFYQTNVVGTQNVIEACFKNKVSQLIYTSSPSVIFDQYDMENVDETVPYPSKYLAPYPETKALAEKLVRKAAQDGLNTIILRPHLIWGPEDNHVVPGIIQRAKSLKQVGRKDDLVDTIYVDNAADAHILACEKLLENPSLSGNIYFISQDEPISKWVMANAFLEAAGLAPIKGHVSGRTAYFAGMLCEAVYKIFRIKEEPPMTRFAAKELSTSHWFNISKAKKDLGYYPKVSTQEGLERLKQWLSTSG
ncbi:MAG: NAD-dependent epimerase/dehydratase family protein [Proteobacteria bacterium]|nr:NAD-dependent epimerase/dehydratase family protein [Pseudomonadota bacterium]MBU1387660.1 NAD-dependent epimerase/dehydratase family protein [Pseudomonadota bacterium]MBU1543692.1 NAD-dependent epimerase/dehydratase family protein [Pseudomonadota bacterium]MBU2482571.1 NAD-dependent epimerase/dehydratase family protein [Pseudomonadota bacterium]